jgi:hypothetical protein
MDGSTEYIIDVIERAEPGSVWAVGTEINLVSRLAAEHPDKTIFCLDPIVCPCSTMYRIHPAYLAWVLDNLVEGTVVNRITVDPETARYARLALDRMLEVAVSTQQSAFSKLQSAISGAGALPTPFGATGESPRTGSRLSLTNGREPIANCQQPIANTPGADR